MKAFLFLLFFCSQQSLADTSLVETVVDSMAKKYIQSKVQNYATTEAEQLAGQALKGDYTGWGGKALSIYGFAQDLKGYKEAPSDSARCQALAHSVADIVTLIVPPAGAIAQGIIFAQDMAAAFIFKANEIQNKKIMAQIMDLRLQISQLQDRETNAEHEAFKFLIAKIMVTQKTIQVREAEILKRCSLDEDLNLSKQTLTQCLHMLVQDLRLKELDFDLTIQMINFHGIHIVTRRYVSDTEVDQQLGLMQSQVTTLERTIHAAIQRYSEGVVTDLQAQGKASALADRCEGEVLELEFEEWQILKRNQNTQDHLDDVRYDTTSLWNDSCHYVEDQMDPGLVRWVERTSRPKAAASDSSFSDSESRIQDGRACQKDVSC